MLDVDADYVVFRVKVQNHTIRHLARTCTRSRSQVDIERIGLRVVVELYDSSWNARSGKALCRVSPSSSVTTRRIRPPSSGTRPQKRMRPSGWTILLSGSPTIRSHHSLRIYGRFLSTCSSK